MYIFQISENFVAIRQQAYFWRIKRVYILQTINRIQKDVSFMCLKPPPIWVCLISCCFWIYICYICCIISPMKRWSPSSTCAGMEPMTLPFRQSSNILLHITNALNWGKSFSTCSFGFIFCSTLEFLSWKLHGTIPFKSVDSISPPASLLLLFQTLLDNLCQKLKTTISQRNRDLHDMAS